MKNLAFTSLAALGAMALPTAAYAQDDTDQPDVTIGASVGLHDLGLETNDPAFDGFDIDDSGEIYGGFAAVDFPIGGNLFAGVEGNAHFGSGPIDAEYGASARIGFRTDSGAKIYARGGYQWVDIDAGNLVGVDIDDDDLGISTTAHDYLVGVGTEVPVGNVVLRANVDTIAFDTLRGTVGVGFKF
jgi:opacity protein-like surface antigen